MFAGSVVSSMSGSIQGSVMTLVTTGPDGAPMDEASQQSTLSNTSAGINKSNAYMFWY